MLKSELMAILHEVPDNAEVALMYNQGDTCKLRVQAYSIVPESPVVILEPVNCSIDNDTRYLR